MAVSYGQAVTLQPTDTDGTDMDAVDFRVDYWKPSNQTNTPTGALLKGVAVITTAGSPTFNINLAAGFLDEETTTKNKWRFVPTENTTEIPWEDTMKLSVNRRAK